MRNKTTIVLLFGFLSFLLMGVPDNAFASDKTEKAVIIIGNKKLPFDTLSTNELKDIFQRKKTLWEEGEKISFALLDSGKAHQYFVRHYIKKTPAQYHRYWKKLVFSGRGVPPMTFRSEKSLMAHVALTQGAIGYISSKTKPSGVKVIRIVEKKVNNAENAPETDETSEAVSKQSDKKEIPEKKSENIFKSFF